MRPCVYASYILYMHLYDLSKNIISITRPIAYYSNIFSMHHKKIRMHIYHRGSSSKEYMYIHCILQSRKILQKESRIFAVTLIRLTISHLHTKNNELKVIYHCLRILVHIHSISSLHNHL